MAEFPTSIPLPDLPFRQQRRSGTFERRTGTDKSKNQNWTFFLGGASSLSFELPTLMTFSLDRRAVRIYWNTPVDKIKMDDPHFNQNRMGRGWCRIQSGGIRQRDRSRYSRRTKTGGIQTSFITSAKLERINTSTGHVVFLESSQM